MKKDLITEILDDTEEVVKRAFEDALIWGQGFIKIDSKGKLARVSVEEADKFVSYLKQNGQKLLDKVRKA